MSRGQGVVVVINVGVQNFLGRDGVVFLTIIYLIHRLQVIL